MKFKVSHLKVKLSLEFNESQELNYKIFIYFSLIIIFPFNSWCCVQLTSCIWLFFSCLRCSLLNSHVSNFTSINLIRNPSSTKFPHEGVLHVNFFMLIVTHQLIWVTVFLLGMTLHAIKIKWESNEEIDSNFSYMVQAI